MRRFEERTAPAEWQRLMEVNLTGCFLGCRAVLPVDGGRGIG